MVEERRGLREREQLRLRLQTLLHCNLVWLGSLLGSKSYTSRNLLNQVIVEFR